MVYPVWSGRTAVDSDGGIWLLVIADEGQPTARSINRELYHISPNGEAKLIAKLPSLHGSCTLETMAVGPDKAAYIILGPEFNLVRVRLDSTVETLANHMYGDPLGIAIGKTGEIVFTSGDGIFRLQPKR
jgi:hypothetical protein